MNTNKIIDEIRAPLLARIEVLEEMVFHLEERLGYRINPEWIAATHRIRLPSQVDYVAIEVGPEPEHEHRGAAPIPD